MSLRCKDWRESRPHWQGCTCNTSVTSGMHSMSLHLLTFLSSFNNHHQWLLSSVQESKEDLTEISYCIASFSVQRILKVSLLGSPTSLIPVSYRFLKRKSVGRKRYSCLLELKISSVLKLYGKCNTAQFSFPLSRRSSKELRGQFFDKMPSPWVLFQY